MRLKCEDFQSAGIKTECTASCHRDDGTACSLAIAPPKAGWTFLKSWTQANVCCGLVRSTALKSRSVWARALRAGRLRVNPLHGIRTVPVPILCPGCMELRPKTDFVSSSGVCAECRS